MNIIFSCGSRSWGGLEIQTLKLSITFQQRGHNVLLLIPENSTLLAKAKENNVKVVPIKWSNAKALFNIFKVRKIIRGFKPQIIHTQLSHDLWVLSPAMTKKSGAKLILTRRMNSAVNKKDIFHRYLYKKIDLLLCVSTFISENVKKTTAIEHNKVNIHFNGLDLQKFNPELYNHAECRRKFDIAENSIVIGFLGRFTFLKGHHEYFEAGKILQQKYPEMQFVFLVAGGDSFGEEAYGNKVRAYGINLLGENNIVFTGDITNIPEVLRAMDILVFPSHEESFGNVLCEAGAMEIPVVASNSGGVPDIVIDKETGILVEPKNSEKISEAIGQYIDNPNLIKQHGKAARKHINEKFTEKNQLDKLEKMYFDLTQ